MHSEGRGGNPVLQGSSRGETHLVGKTHHHVEDRGTNAKLAESTVVEASRRLVLGSYSHSICAGHSKSPRLSNGVGISSRDEYKLCQAPTGKKLVNNTSGGAPDRIQ